MRTKRNEG